MIHNAVAFSFVFGLLLCAVGLRGKTMDYFLELSFAIFIKKIGYIFGWFDFYLYFCGVNKMPLSIYRYGDSLVF